MRSPRLPPGDWVDMMLAIVLAGAAVASSVTQLPSSGAWSDLLAVAAAGSVTLRRRVPLAMALIASVAVICYALLPGASTPLWTFATVLIVAYSIGAYLTGGPNVIALVALLASGYVLQAASRGSMVEMLLTPPLIIGAPALAGSVVRRARGQAEQLRRVTAELVAERERYAEAVASAERARIARELHDVIAHTVSVMVVQAGAAQQMLSPDSPAQLPVREIRHTGRQALAEMRRLLGLLRNGELTYSSPQPGLSQIDELVASAGACLSVVGTPFDVGPGMGLAAYRIAQEALTNARRHAPDAGVRVRLTYRADEIGVEVVDDGGQVAGGCVEGASGHGLVGMRERAALYGGRLTAGPGRDGSGWRVEALFPLASVATG